MALNLYFNGMDGTDGLKGGGFSSISGRLQGTMEGEENWRSAATRQRDLQQGWPFKRMMQKWENQCDVMRSCRAEKGENSRFQHGANLQDNPTSSTTSSRGRLAHPHPLARKISIPISPHLSSAGGTALYARLCRQTVTKSTGHDEPALQGPMDAWGCAAAMDAPWSGSWVGDAEVHEWWDGGFG